MNTNTEQTYAEKCGQQPFDWHKTLESAKHNPPDEHEYDDLVKRAEKWPSLRRYSGGPAMNVDQAACNGCKEIKPLSDFYTNPKGYRLKRCRKCHAASMMRWVNAHKEHRNAGMRRRRAENLTAYKAREDAWREKNRERRKQTRIAWVKKNPDKLRAYDIKHRAKTRERSRRHTEELTDGYVNLVLTNGKTTLRAADIPQDLRDLKRAHLKMKRLLKNENKH